MREADFDQFGTMLDAVCSLLSRGTYAPSAANTALWFRALSGHDLDAVRGGFDGHVKDPQRGRFVPTPADILAQITGQAAADGRPGAEEAWAMALRFRDETETIVWTAEMSQAWQIARAVMDLGDEVGARMAFREAYTRLVEEARALRMPATWSASLGFDPQRREHAIAAAVMAGRLPHSELQALPPPANGSLLSLAESTATSETHRLALRQLADRMRAQPEEVSIDQLEHERTRALKAEASRLVAEHLEWKRGD